MLACWKESYDKPREHIKKQHHLPTKVHIVKAKVFLVVMYRCESWTKKKAEHQRIDAFKLWCWRRLLRVMWTARRSNQSILKESILNILWKDWCWSWSSNTLATWCTAPTHWKRPWCWERLKAKGEGNNKGWDGWKALLTQWTWVWASSRRWLKDREAWRATVHGVANSQTWLSDWITTIHTHTNIYSGSRESNIINASLR